MKSLEPLLLIPLLLACGAVAAQGAQHMATLPFGGERIVKGAPYCADAVHEQVQWLADPQGGAPNRMATQRTTRLCRDGEGRTRQELERGGRKVVYLRDPGAHESWILDPERKTVRPAGFGAWVDDGAIREHGERMREYAERMREWARGVAERVRTAPPAPPSPATPPTPPTPPVPPTPAVITFGPGGERDFDVRVMRLDGGAGDMPPAPMSWSLRAFSPRGPGATSPLPSKELEGLRVNGERTSWTIEAGKVGNDRPIVMFREVWTAPELMLTVASRDFDPRSGEVNYRLQNVKRGEPDAALMRVPADYAHPRRAYNGEPMSGSSSLFGCGLGFGSNAPPYRRREPPPRPSPLEGEGGSQICKLPATARSSVAVAAQSTRRISAQSARSASAICSIGSVPAIVPITGGGSALCARAGQFRLASRLSFIVSLPVCAAGCAATPPDGTLRSVRTGALRGRYGGVKAK